MVFSRYVLDAITSLNYVVKDHDTTFQSFLREASEKAPNTTDTHILDIILGASTMRYKEKERTFGPLVIWNDGSRSFALEDLTRDDLDILCTVIQITESSHIRTKYSHIVWLLNKDNRYGEIAVAGYLDGFQKKFDPEHWVECYEQISSAYHIASVMGNKSESFKKTRMAINQKLIQMNGSDPLFLSLNLL